MTTIEQSGVRITKREYSPFPLHNSTAAPLLPIKLRKDFYIIISSLSALTLDITTYNTIIITIIRKAFIFGRYSVSSKEDNIFSLPLDLY